MTGKLDIKDERSFTVLTDRVTFDYNSLSLSLVRNR